MGVKDSDQLTPKRRGAIAVCVREGKLLVIRRSDQVAAPGAFCFPGGGIEESETEEQALVRELREELNVTVRPIRRLWRSETAWGVELCWWLAGLHDEEAIAPNAEEVADYLWLSPEEIGALPGLLSSNVAFLDALSAGEFTLDDESGGGTSSNGERC
mgnify:CR=1 FL=1